MTSFVAFLRGINIGGRKVLMEDLQKVFEDLGFENVQTLIASGNVLFDASESMNVKNVLEEALQKQFGFFIPVILRTQEDIKKLVKENPFKDSKVEKGTRLHVTVFDSEIIQTSTVEKDGFTIMPIGKKELASVVGPSGKTTELMTFIDKTFGKNSTTRNWNTIQKLVAE